MNLTFNEEIFKKPYHIRIDLYCGIPSDLFWDYPYV